MRRAENVSNDPRTFASNFFTCFQDNFETSKGNPPHRAGFWDFQRRTYLTELVLPARSRVDPRPHCRPPFCHRLPRQGSHQLKEMLKEKVTKDQHSPTSLLLSSWPNTPRLIFQHLQTMLNWSPLEKPIIALVKISLFQFLYKMQLIWGRLIPKN